MFPALHRAGLIEATITPVGQVVSSERFRPFTGPASLKLVRARSPPPPRRARFRPFTGPASLKPAGDVDVDVAVPLVSGPSQGRPH